MLGLRRIGLYARGRVFNWPHAKFITSHRQPPEPSLESMEAFLTSASNPGHLRVAEVVGGEIVRIPTVNGLGIGAVVEITPSDPNAKPVQGIVIQFDKNFASIGLMSPAKISSDAKLSLLRDTFRFHVPCGWEQGVGSLGRTGEPLETSGDSVIDFLLGPLLPPGVTVGLYGVPAHYKINPKESSIVRFPSTDGVTTGFGQYADLIKCANAAAVVSGRNNKTIFLVDLRHFEETCKSLQLHATLPISPTALVASVLQLSNGSNLSVIAFASSPADFGNELERCVDIGVDFNENARTDNVIKIIKRFSITGWSDGSVRSLLLGKLLESHSKYTEMNVKEKEFHIYTDFWEREEMDSFETLMKLVHAIPTKTPGLLSHRDQLILMRAFTILHFNKTTKRDAPKIGSFAADLLGILKATEHELYNALPQDSLVVNTDSMMQRLDQCLLKQRYALDLINP